MAVAIVALAVHEETLRHHEVELVPRPRHGDVKEPPFLFDLRARSGREIRRQAAVDRIEIPISTPALGRMDGGEDKVVVVEERCAGAVAGGSGGSSVSR